MEFEVLFHGGYYRGNIANAQEWHIYFFGGYELKEIALIEDILTMLGDPVAMDVGANLGNHSIAMAKHASAVYAFEPFDMLADRIEDHISRNGITNIHVLRFGLGAKNEVRPYYLEKKSRNIGTGSFLPEHTSADKIGEFQIRKGDDWVDGRRIDFIKIDVEGYEAFVLAGLRATLAANTPVVMMEITESSWKIFQRIGGLEKVFPFSFSKYEITNPRYPLYVFQSGLYGLRKIEVISPRSASFNVLILPEARNDLLSPIIMAAER